MATIYKYGTMYARTIVQLCDYKADWTSWENVDRWGWRECSQTKKIIQYKLIVSIFEPEFSFWKNQISYPHFYVYNIHGWNIWWLRRAEDRDTFVYNADGENWNSQERVSWYHLLKRLIYWVSVLFEEEKEKQSFGCRRSQEQLWDTPSCKKAKFCSESDGLYRDHSSLFLCNEGNRWIGVWYCHEYNSGYPPRSYLLVDKCLLLETQHKFQPHLPQCPEKWPLADHIQHW